MFIYKTIYDNFRGETILKALKIVWDTELYINIKKTILTRHTIHILKTVYFIYANKWIFQWWGLRQLVLQLRIQLRGSHICLWHLKDTWERSDQAMMLFLLAEEQCILWNHFTWIFINLVNATISIWYISNVGKRRTTENCCKHCKSCIWRVHATGTKLLQHWADLINIVVAKALQKTDYWLPVCTITNINVTWLYRALTYQPALPADM